MRAREFIIEEITKVIQNFDPNDPDNYEGMSFQRTRADGVTREVPHGSSMHNNLYKQVTGKEAPPSPTEKGTLDYLKGAMQKYQDNPPPRGPVIKEPSVKYPQDTIKPIKTIDDPDEPELGEAANAAQQAAIAINMKKHHQKPKNESAELEEEFDLIESIIDRLAAHNGVDAEVIWEDLETLTEDELYAFAVTSEPIMESQGVAEGLEQQYLWHGSRQKIPMLEPRQSLDTGGAAGSNQNAIYATSDPKVAIAVGGLTTPDSDTAMFPNDPQMVLFSGKIRKGQNVYLHKLPFNGPDGKPQFVQGAHDREFYSIPGVKGIKPVEIKEVPVDKYLNLIRQATPADLELRKKNMKQGVAESEAWQKANNRDRTDGMSRKAVNTYRREHPGSKLQTAVTTKPSKLKKGSKASKRRKSYCSRSRGQMKMHSISCAKTPDKAICKARRRWNC
jgi:hypothetical protein